MSLRDAVVALRSLKAELEAIRKSKAEIEAVNHGLVEELRLAKERGQIHANGTVVRSSDDGSPARSTTAAAGSASSSDVQSQAYEDNAVVTEELREAQAALKEAQCEKKELERKAIALQERLEALEVESQEATLTANQEMQEALAARDESRARAKEARAEAARQEERAAAAENQCASMVTDAARVGEDAASLRSRLEETSKELELTRDTLIAVKTRPQQGGMDGTNGGGVEAEDGLADSEAVAELESELQSVREAVSHNRESAELTDDLIAPAAELSASIRETERLEAELERIIGENQDLRKSLEAAQNRLADAVANDAEAVSRSSAAAAEEGPLSAEKDEEIASLRSRLTTASEEVEAVERFVASEKLAWEEEVSSRDSALREAKEEMESLKASLARAVEGRQEDARRVASESVIVDERVLCLEQELESAQAHLTAADQRLRATEESAAAAAVAAAAAAATYTEHQEQEAVVSASRIEDLQKALRDAQVERDALKDSHRSALAIEAENQKVQKAEEAAVAAASVAEIEGALKVKEKVEAAARESVIRADKAEKNAAKLKSQVMEAKKDRAETERAAARAMDEEREKGQVEIAKVQAARLEVEDTLLLANKELQRLQERLQEVQSSADPMRAECEYLTRQLEALRATAAADSSAAEDEIDQATTAMRIAEQAEEAAREEIMFLRKELQQQEGEGARGGSGTAGDKETGRGGGDADEGIGEREYDEEESGQAAKITVKDEEEGGGGGKEEPEEAEAIREIVEERDSLRNELQRARQEGGVRMAGLETQLADTEREAANTQRRLHRQQTQLESDLEELQTNYDALRLEMARMDASIQDAAELNTPSVSSFSPSPIRKSGGGGGGSDFPIAHGPTRGAISERSGRDATAMGAGLGASVGNILRGRLWTGFGGGSGGGGVGGLEDGRSPTALATAGKQERGTGGGGKAGGAGGRWHGEQRPGGAEVLAAGPANTDRESFTRVRDNMMAKLKEAAIQPATRRSGSNDIENKGGSSDSSRREGEQSDAGSVGDAEGGREEEENEEKEPAAEVTGAFVGRMTSTGQGTDTGGIVGPVESSGSGPADDGFREEKKAASGKEDWAEETMDHPPPDYGIDSPVIRYLLHQWSSDPEKLRYLTLWLRCVTERRRVPDAFPAGLQLVGLAPEVKDGFLTLIIPMIRHMGGLPVWVHSRRVPLQDGEEGERWDLRVKVELEGGGFGAGMVEKGSQSRQPQAGGPGGEGGPLSGRIEQQLSRMQLREMRRQKSHATR